MKKTKKSFKEYEKQVYYQTASRLLESNDYAKYWEKLNKAKQITNQFYSFPEGESPAEIETEIRKKYSIAQAYDLDFLRKVKKGEKALLAEIVDIVDPRTDSENNEDGYLCLKIKLNAPKNIIHYLIDTIIDIRLRVYKENGIDILGKKKRFRKERTDAMKVWEERKLRKPFKQIAKDQNITVPSARKKFYKAYELIYGEKFNPADYKKPEIPKDSLKKECSTCKEKPTCKDLCPDVIAFVNQNSAYLREKLQKVSKKQAEK